MGAHLPRSHGESTSWTDMSRMVISSALTILFKTADLQHLYYMRFWPERGLSPEENAETKRTRERIGCVLVVMLVPRHVRGVFFSEAYNDEMTLSSLPSSAGEHLPVANLTGSKKKLILLPGMAQL